MALTCLSNLQLLGWVGAGDGGVGDGEMYKYTDTFCGKNGSNCGNGAIVQTEQLSMVLAFIFCQKISTKIRKLSILWS